MDSSIDLNYESEFVIHTYSPVYENSGVYFEIRELRDSLLELGIGLDSRGEIDSYKEIGDEEHRFRFPLDKTRTIFKAVFKSIVGDGYVSPEKVISRTGFKLYVSPSRKIEVVTETAKEIASFFVIAELLLPLESVYSKKVREYMQSYGEITPAASANLELLRSQLGISSDEATDLQQIAIGKPLAMSLEEKYQRFRKKLSVLTNESDLSGKRWNDIEKQAEMLYFPKKDLDFLCKERRKELLS